MTEVQKSKNLSVSKDAEKTSRKKQMTELLNKLPALRDLFDLRYKIGEGTFSNVYLGLSKVGGQQFAIKHLIPTSHPSRVVRELRCMQEIGGQDNVVNVTMCLHVNDCIVFIMPYQVHDSFSSYIGDMDVNEVRNYIKQLLLAVRRVHSFGIIHRDIKPSNFLYSRKEKKFLLVDFGLAQHVDECGDLSENSGHVSNKRKRDLQSSEPQSQSKRQALQPLSSNSNLANTSFGEDHSHGSSLKRTSAKRSFEGENRAPVETSQPSFIRIQSSQMRSYGGVFVKPWNPITSDKKPRDEVKKCQCDGKPQVCNTCLTRRAQNAPRAGTPGFRPPEVLLKCPIQSTAVDIWAVGVILLCILSSTYPFFRSPDDVTSLAEIISLFGSHRIKTVAKKLGRNVIVGEEKGAVDLRKLCERLRRRKYNLPKDKGALCKHCSGEIIPDEGCICLFSETSNKPIPGLRPSDIFPSDAYNLLYQLLEIDPTLRITAEEALRHPFISNIS